MPNQPLPDVNTMSATEVLQELYNDFYLGVSSLTIIGMNGDDYHHIRSGKPTGRKKTSRLRGLLSFYRELRAYGIDDAWIDGNLDVPEGYNPFRNRLYEDTDERRAQLLELALHPERTYDLLDQIDPTWRDYRDGFESFVAADGHRSIRSRNTAFDVPLPPPNRPHKHEAFPPMND